MAEGGVHDSHTYITAGARRGSHILVHYNYKYIMNRKKKEVLYWRCHRTNCRVTMSTEVYDDTLEHPPITVRNEPVAHYHPEDTSQINQEDFRNRAIKKIKEDTGRTALSAYTSVSTSLSQAGGDQSSLPRFDHVKKVLNRARSEATPANPRTLDDVEVPYPYTHTYGDRNFCLAISNAGEDGLLLFATDQDLRALGHCNEFYMDATHKSCPKPYKQYMTIHGNYRGQVILMASILMTGKTPHIIIIYWHNRNLYLADHKLIHIL